MWYGARTRLHMVSGWLIKDKLNLGVDVWYHTNLLVYFTFMEDTFVYGLNLFAVLDTHIYKRFTFLLAWNIQCPRSPIPRSFHWGLLIFIIPQFFQRIGTNLVQPYCRIKAIVSCSVTGLYYIWIWRKMAETTDTLVSFPCAIKGAQYLILLKFAPMELVN